MARGGGKTRCECGWSAAVCSSDLETYQGVTATITLDKWLSSNGVTTNNTTAHILDGKSITFAATVTNTGTDGLTESGMTVTDANPTDRKTTRPNSSHPCNSYTYICLTQTESQGLSTHTPT